MSNNTKIRLAQQVRHESGYTFSHSGVTEFLDNAVFSGNSFFNAGVQFGNLILNYDDTGKLPTDVVAFDGIDTLSLTPITDILLLASPNFSAYTTIQYLGVDFPSRTKLTFSGDGISQVVDDLINDRTIIEIASGGTGSSGSGYSNIVWSGGVLPQQNTVFFSGSGVQNVVNDGINSRTIVNIEGGSSTIGQAEDGSYLDGLFTDFTPSTPIGTAVDRFNEVLKLLAPSPAPSLDDIASNTNGVRGNLSFGTSKGITGYEDVTGRTTPVGIPDLPLTAFDVNDSYNVTGNRRGLFASGNITIILNADVPVDPGTPNPSYPVDAFGNGNEGILRIFLNETEISNYDLTNTAAINTTFGTDSSINLSAAQSNLFPNGNAFDTFQYRTGTITIGDGDWRLGYNFVRLEHDLGATTAKTNYIEWVYDNNSDALSSSGESMHNLILGGSRFLSGVEYFTNGTVQYSGVASNVYTNVFADNTQTVSTTSTNLTRTNLGISGVGVANFATTTILPDLNLVAGSENTDINLNAEFDILPSSNLLIGNDLISARFNIPHPLKTNLQTNIESETDFLFYNVNDSSTAFNENFTGENFRLIEADYSSGGTINHTQVIAGNQVWNSQEDILTGPIANRGLLVINGDVVYPNSVYLGNTYGFAVNGDFNLPNAPINNRDYTLASGNLTYVRRFQSSNTASLGNFTLRINHNASINIDTTTIFDNVPTLSANEIKVEFNLLRTNNTSFKTYNAAFVQTGLQDDIGLSGAISSNATQTEWLVTLNNLRIGNGDLIIIRIIAGDNFTRAISNIQILEF